MNGTLLLLVAAMAAGPGAPLRMPFVARSMAHGVELWTTDGTPGGTRLVKDIKPGRHGGCTLSPVAFGGAYYFAADDGVHGMVLWRTDGTGAHTSRVPNGKDRQVNPLVFTPTVFDGALYFWNLDQLWRTDPAVRTFELVDHPADGEFTPCGVAVVDGALVYGREGRDRDYPLLGHSFCRIDAGKPNEKKCSPFTPPVDHFVFRCELWPFGKFAYFITFDGSLWRTDGTAAGTSVVRAFPWRPFHAGFVAYKGALYFQLLDQGTELWKTDGTPAGTVRVMTLTEDGYEKVPAIPVVYKGQMYFNGYRHEQDSSAFLWRSDGTAAGTVQVKDLYPGVRQMRLTSLFVQGDTLFLIVSPDSGGDELWRSDGTAAGTVLVKRLDEIQAR